jgi:hypothetical protein
VYYKEPVSIDEAINSDIKGVKVITQDDKIFLFDSIYYKNNILYGLWLKKGKTEIKINEDSIKEIHLFNKRKSYNLSIITTLGIPFGILLIGLIAYITNPPDLF